MGKAKRYSPCTDNMGICSVYVAVADYDALAADNQRLLEALEKIKFRADCFVEDDADMQPHSAEAISGIARAALAGSKESSDVP